METDCPIQLSEDQLNEVEEMSSALLPPAEIALLVGLNSSERELFCEICKTHEDSEIYLAYHRGRLRTKYELRRTVVRLAKAGSPAAEPLADRYIKEQLIKQ